MDVIPITDKKEEKALTTKSTNLNDLVRFSFMIVYTILLTTGTITLIEALRTDIAAARHVFNLETCISIIAGYYYSIFITKTASPDIDWSEITKLRYIDWSITTPLMLIVLCIFLSKNSNTIITFRTMTGILILNGMMLGIGYYGVVNPENKLFAMIGGFIPFFAMFYLIYIRYAGNSKANNVLLGVYFVLWSLYGVVYMMDEQYKNISMNILDLIAKCFVGLGLWIYFTKIVKKY
jgi:bacteriorhodopsin